MPYTLQTPQTKEEFLAKYAYALDPQGRFIPGKANLEYDDMNASDLYDYLMGSSPMYDADGNVVGTTEPQAEINADWIEDPRAKGWIAQHPAGAAIIGTVLGGVGANALGLLGSGSGVGGFGASGAGGALGSGTAAGSTAATAFGGSSPAWLSGANAVGAGDLALASMPQVTASSLGGAAGGALGAGAAMEAFPQVTITGAKGAGSGAFGGSSTPSWMTGANAVSAGDLAKTAMPSLPSSVSGGNLLTKASNFLTENPLLTKVGGAVLGAALGGQDSTVSSQKDPWAPAQPYLKENLARNAAMQDFYAKNPFSTEQKTAYQGLLNTLQNNQANAPVMQGIANSFMGSNRGLLGGVPQFTQGATAPVIDWSKYANIGMRG